MVLDFMVEMRMQKEDICLKPFLRLQIVKIWRCHMNGIV